MARRRWWAVVGVMLAGCTATVSTMSVTSTDIGEVQIGQTMPEVIAALGQPQQVWPTITTPAGTEQVVWEYAAASSSTTSWTGTIHPATPRRVLSLEQQHQMAPLSDTSYLIVFVDGRVSEVVR